MNHDSSNSVSKLRRTRILRIIASLLAALVCGGLCVAAFRVDEQLSVSLRVKDLRGDVEKTIMLAEAFAHFSGVVMILVTLLVVDVQHRKKLWAVVILTSIAGLLANLAKAGFDRMRPHAIEASLTVQPAETPLNGWTLGGDSSFWDSAHRSFPSGHTATAVALALGLSWIYPRGKWCFSILAMAAAYQRVYAGAHFVSDILAGAVIAFIVAAVWFKFVDSNIDDPT